MNRLALQSLRARPAGFAACFLSIFLGSTLIASFASLIETSAGKVSGVDRETLSTMGLVVGGWAVVIVMFSVASTLTLTVGQRSHEMALLRTIGATPRQLRRMVIRETVVVATVAAALAMLPGWLVGDWVLSRVIDARMVAPDIEHQIGFATVASTLVAMVLVAAGAAALAGRRATSASAGQALVDSSTGRSRMGRLRIGSAVLLVLVGIGYAVLTVTVMADKSDPYLAMSTAGPASIFVSVGFAILAPLFLQGGASVAAGPLGRSGVSGYLAAYNARRRPHQLSGALMPVIIFTGIATGTMYLMAIENDAMSGLVKSAEAKNIELLNYIVVGMIAAFAAIMVVNTMVAATAKRRREFGQQRLAGATPAQVLGVVGLEGALVSATGVALGAVASVATVVPYSIARTDQVLPEAGIGIVVLIALVATLVTLGSGLGTARHTVRTPAVEAATA